MDDLLSLDEIEVVCAQCAFPTVTEYDEEGNTTGFREEPGPKSEEEALAQGWLDHGLGFYCPKCSLAYLEERAADEAAGARSGATGDLGELLDEQFLKTMHPTVSDETIAVFVAILRHDRLGKLRAKLGLPGLDPVAAPQPRDEQQVLEFLEVSESIKKALAK
jgi:hypothetical protein